MVLLDTCTLLWLVNDQARIVAPARRVMERHAGAIYVSAVSALEIGLKARRGKLKLPLAIDQWFAAVLESHSLLEAPISGAIAARSTLLPPLHQDPADRILIATAQDRDWTLLTPDPLIRQYAGVTLAWD